MKKNMLMTIGIVVGLIFVVSNSVFAAVIQKTKLELKHIEVIGDKKKEVSSIKTTTNWKINTTMKQTKQ